MLFTQQMLLFIVSGEKKLGKVITPDTWKDGARNTTGEPRKTNKFSVNMCFLWITVRTPKLSIFRGMSCVITEDRVL